MEGNPAESRGVQVGTRRTTWGPVGSRVEHAAKARGISTGIPWYPTGSHGATWEIPRDTMMSRSGIPWQPVIHPREPDSTASHQKHAQSVQSGSRLGLCKDIFAYPACNWLPSPWVVIVIVIGYASVLVCSAGHRLSRPPPDPPRLRDHARPQSSP